METEIRTLLYAALESIAEQCDLPVSWPNEDFSKRKPKSKDAAYIEASLLPSEPDVRGVTNGWSIYRWAFQTSIHVRDGTRDFKASDVIEILKDAFPFNTKFIGDGVTYTVIKQPFPAPPIPDDGWFITPVTTRIMATN